MAPRKRARTETVKVEVAAAPRKPYYRRPRYRNWPQRWLRKKYPKSEYGVQYVPRSEHTLAAYGPTYRTATDEQKAARQASNYHGMGMYTGNGMFNPFTTKLGRKFRHGLTDLVGKTARELGSVIPGGGDAADFLARKAMKASGIGMYTGQGGYSTVKNELIAGGHGSEGIMRFDVQDDQDGIVVSHSEYVMDVYAPPANETKADIKLPLNAGSSKTFPMLSQIAANFEDFEVLQMAFTYKPSLSDWQTTNGQVGQVLFATNYNPAAELWTTKQQLLAQTGSTSARTIDSTFHGIECDSSKTHNDGHYLVRTGPPRPEQDLNDYDHGWTQLSVVDTPKDHPNITLGELHVSYTIKLTKPRVWQKAGNIIPRELFQRWNYTCDLTTVASIGDASAGWDAATMDDTVLHYARQSNIGCKFGLAKHDATHNPLPAGHDWMAITLPAGMAGDYEFRITGSCRTTGTQRALCLPLFNYNGQITSLATDMDLRTNTYAPVHTSQAFYNGQEQLDKYRSSWENQVYWDGMLLAGDQGRMFQQRMPFRVSVARDGKDNQILFVFALQTDGEISLTALKIEIVGLNTRLAWRQDGTNDKIIFEDEAKQIVTY